MTDTTSLSSMLLDFAKQNKGLSNPKLRESFIHHAISRPDACQEALGFWWSLNHRRLLTPNEVTYREAEERESTTKRRTASVLSKILLMQIMLPTGRTLAESTGAECTQAGGWLARVGMHVGPTGVVGQILDEVQLRTLLNESGTKKHAAANKEAAANA